MAVILNDHKCPDTFKLANHKIQFFEKLELVYNSNKEMPYIYASSPLFEIKKKEYINLYPDYFRNKVLTLYRTIPTFNDPEKATF